MKNLSRYNPLVVSISFILTAVTGIFNLKPILSMLFLLGALFLYYSGGYCENKKLHWFIIITFFGCALLNPVFSHNGKTVLFFVSNNPITLESFIYGIFMGVTVSATVYWFAVYSQLMTSDKVIYTIGKISKKAALVLAMSLRFVPMFISQYKEITASQKALGLYKDETIFSRIKATARVTDILLTNIIEKTIVTADSMEARGYSCSGHTTYNLFRLNKKDYVLLFTTILLFVICIFATARGNFSFNVYPEISVVLKSRLSIAGYISYGLMCICPSIIEGGEKLRWHYLRSKISHSATLNQSQN